MQKAIKTKAKVSLLPLLMLKEIDQRIARGKPPAENTKASNQEASMKDPSAKEPKF